MVNGLLLEVCAQSLFPAVPHDANSPDACERFGSRGKDQDTDDPLAAFFNGQTAGKFGILRAELVSGLMNNFGNSKAVRAELELSQSKSVSLGPPTKPTRRLGAGPAGFPEAGRDFNMLRFTAAAAEGVSVGSDRRSPFLALLLMVGILSAIGSLRTHVS